MVNGDKRLLLAVPFTVNEKGAFWEQLNLGRRCAVDEHLFDYYLEVLPPYFMGKLVTLMDGTQKYASFGFVEGADRVVAFWRESGRHYAQQTTIVSRGS